jgi:uncharacterized phage protein gp47/JayE
MPIFAEREDKIFGDILFDLVENTNLTRSSPGSKTRALAQAISKKLGRMWTQFDTNMVQSFINGAEGKYLDYIGSMMGVPRLGERPASIVRDDKLIKFYTDIGTFGTINGGSSITISAGEIISTGKDQTGTLYKLPYTTILPFDVSEYYVAAESIATGDAANVGKGTLVNHSVTSYIDQLNKTLKVTNTAEIFMSRGIETDTNYRFRIANQVIAAEQANTTAIRLAALTVPGVADVVNLPFNRGIGTFDLLIKATTPRVPEGVLTAVDVAVSRVKAEGIVAYIRKPKETGVSMVGTITTKRKLTAEEESGIISAAQENVRAYIDNLDIGEEFIVNEVVERVMSVSDLIRNLGTTGQPLDQLFIYKESRLSDNKVRENLIADYRPQAEEKLYVEDRYAGDTPILFRIA